MTDTNEYSQRIHALAQHDPSQCLFGCEKHKYKLGACLTEAELDALESAYGIEIPAEYRAFLATVGNGGAGSGYGLEPLKPPVAPQSPSNQEIAVILTDDNGQVIHKAKYEDVAANYDPNRSNNTGTAKELFPLKAPYRSITDEMWDVQFPNWDDRLRSEHQANKDAFSRLAFGHGVLKIAHYGSGIYAVLVLNGPFRSQVWVTDPHMGDYVPASMRTDLHDSTVKAEKAYALHQQPFTFNGWYGHWLDSALRELAREYENAR